MRVLNGFYAQQFNDKYHRVGLLFQGRFDARVLRDDEHLTNACEYIWNNAVRIGRCKTAADWPWNGASEYRPDPGTRQPRAACGSWIRRNVRVETGAASAQDRWWKYERIAHPNSPSRSPIRCGAVRDFRARAPRVSTSGAPILRASRASSTRKRRFQ